MGRFLGTITLLSLTLAGCSPSAPMIVPTTAREPTFNPAPPVAKVGGLKAVISPGMKRDTVLVEYRNGSSNDVVLSEQVLITNSLALEVLDSTGRRMSTVPPSVPWSRDDGVRIPAGGVHRQEYTLTMFDPALKTGRYRVRTRLEEWTCEPMEYVVK